MSDDGRRRRLPRWTRSVRRRPAAFVALLLLSTLAVSVSILTPMLLRSVQQASLSAGVARADIGDRAVVVTALALAGETIGVAVGATDSIGASFDDGLWDEPVTAIGSSDPFPWQASGRAARESAFLAVTLDSSCAAFHLTEGRCPTQARQVLLPASTERTLGARLLSQVVLNPDSTRRQTVLTVVGVYDDAEGYGRVLAAPDALAGTPLSQPSAALVIGGGHIETTGINFTSYLTVSVRQPVGLDSVDQIDRDIRSAKAAALDGDAGLTSALVQSGLPDVLTRLQQQNAAAAVITTAIALETLALAWFALGAMMQRVSRVRAVEWGIGRTRGIVLADWLSTVFAEPLIAVLLGSALGLPAGVLLARGVVGAALGSGVPVDPLEPPVVAAAVLAIAGILVALAIASLRSARLPLTSLLRETTEPRQLSRAALVVQSGVLLVTAAVIWSVVVQSVISGPELALLVPSLVALTIGVVALRLTVVLVRGATRRPPRTLGGLVVGRQVARAPSALGGAVMVAVGLALATYVFSLYGAAGRLEDDRAAVDAGAGAVLRVTVPFGTSLESAVRTADPSGRQAMAARELTGIGATDTSRVVAVDTPRLAAVTTWRAAWRGGDPASLAQRLDPASGTPLTFRGTRLSLTVAHAKAATPDEADPNLRMIVTFDTGTGWRTVDLGLVRDGVLSSGAGEVPCSSGCRLVSIAVVNPSTLTTGPFAEGLTLAAISTDAQPASDFASWLTDKDRWRQRIADATDPTMPATAEADGSPDGLVLTLSADNGGVAAVIEPAVGTSTLPALIAARTPSQPFAGLPDAVFGTDLQQNPLVLTLVGTAPVLPRAGGSGVLVDLGQLERLTDTASAPAVDEVWLAPGAHARVIAALRAEGIRVSGTQTLPATEAEYRQDAPVRSLATVVATAVVALVLTVLALVGARLVGSGPRRRDLRTLRTAGVLAGRLGWLSAVEFAAPTAVGAVLGVLAGLVAFALTVARLPLLAGDGVTPPPDFAPPWTGLALLAAGAVAVAVVAATATSAADARGARL